MKPCGFYFRNSFFLVYLTISPFFISNYGKSPTNIRINRSPTSSTNCPASQIMNSQPILFRDAHPPSLLAYHLKPILTISFHLQIFENIGLFFVIHKMIITPKTMLNSPLIWSHFQSGFKFPKCLLFN